MTYDPTIERIRDGNDIVEVIEEVVRLRKAGAQYQGLCPFHADKKSPSFLVNPGKQVYHCHGCGASGDVFSFIQQSRGVSFTDAKKILADRAGISLEEESQEERNERLRVRREAEALAADCGWFLASIRRALMAAARDIRELDAQWSAWARRQTDMEHPNWEWMALIPELNRLAERYWSLLDRIDKADPQIVFRAYLTWRGSNPKTPREITAREEEDRYQKQHAVFAARFAAALDAGAGDVTKKEILKVIRSYWWDAPGDRPMLLAWIGANIVRAH